MVGNGGARQGTWVLQGRVANQKMVLGSIVSQTAKMSIRAILRVQFYCRGRRFEFLLKIFW